MLVRRPFAERLTGLCLTGLVSALFAPVTFGQTTGQILLPFTIGTIAGGGAATTSGAACSTGGALKATDALGYCCPASQAIFSSDIRGGVTTDPIGSIYVADTSSSQVRRIDPRSGLITTFAGGNKICTGTAVDKNGDGCIATTSTVVNSATRHWQRPLRNVFITGYSDNLVHLVCNAVSPLCTAAQVGTMRIAAGCYTAAAYGTSGNTGDGLTAASSRGSTVASVNQPRGVNADRFGNIYFGDTGNLRFRVVVGPVIPSSTPGIFIHGITGTTSLLTTLAPGSEFTLGTLPCNTNSFDATYDCIVPVTFAPTQIGWRDGPINIQATPAGSAFNGSLTAYHSARILPSIPPHQGAQQLSHWQARSFRDCYGRRQWQCLHGRHGNQVYYTGDGWHSDRNLLCPGRYSQPTRSGSPRKCIYRDIGLEHYYQALAYRACHLHHNQQKAATSIIPRLSPLATLSSTRSANQTLRMASSSTPLPLARRQSP